MNITKLSVALDQLAAQFARRDWKYLQVPAGDPMAKAYEWPGPEDEPIMICVHKGPHIQEPFHQQDFFFFNFAYSGDYNAFSYSPDNYITIQEGECYVGQPYNGYALHSHGDQEIIIIGVMIQKEVFFKTFLPVLASDTYLFHFFLDPQTDAYSEEFIHLRFENEDIVRTLLEMMVVEYAFPQPDTQAVLQPLVLALMMQVARQYRGLRTLSDDEPLASRIVRYIGERSGSVTLREIADRFSYHPNYISTLLRREVGKSFSQILLEQRMERALSLLWGTKLPIEEIASMVGYRDSSNFYKAFRNYYGGSPRTYTPGRGNG